MKSEDDLTFSSEVAETLGIECSVILSLYKKNELNDVSSFQNLVSCIKDILPFINDQIINESVNKLIKYELIEFGSNSNNKNYEVKKPYGNKESNNMNNTWVPSIETMEILDMTDISSKFYKLKLKEFKIYWIDSNQVMASWNSKFIQHVKYKWFKENPKASGIISRLTDKEWAIEYSD